jgi:hypothetical protein
LAAVKEIADPAPARSAELTLPTFPLASVKEPAVRMNPLAAEMRAESEATKSTVPACTIPTVPSDEARTKTEGVGVLVGLEDAGFDGAAVVGRSVGLTVTVGPGTVTVPVGVTMLIEMLLMIEITGLPLTHAVLVHG